MKDVPMLLGKEEFVADTVLEKDLQVWWMCQPVKARKNCHKRYARSKEKVAPTLQLVEEYVSNIAPRDENPAVHNENSPLTILMIEGQNCTAIVNGY